MEISSLLVIEGRIHRSYLQSIICLIPFVLTILKEFDLHPCAFESHRWVHALNLVFPAICSLLTGMVLIILQLTKNYYRTIIFNIKHFYLDRFVEVLFLTTITLGTSFLYSNNYACAVYKNSTNDNLADLTNQAFLYGWSINIGSVFILLILILAKYLDGIGSKNKTALSRLFVESLNRELDIAIESSLKKIADDVVKDKVKMEISNFKNRDLQGILAKRGYIEVDGDDA